MKENVHVNVTQNLANLIVKKQNAQNLLLVFKKN